jgi:hypothetical protein
MADGSLKQVFPSRLEALETVYAMTVHKSQGSEFDHTALVMPDTISLVLTRGLSTPASPGPGPFSPWQERQPPFWLKQ